MFVNDCINKACHYFKHFLKVKKKEQLYNALLSNFELQMQKNYMNIIIIQFVNDSLIFQSLSENAHLKTATFSPIP